jgi:hypothetical protein
VKALGNTRWPRPALSAQTSFWSAVGLLLSVLALCVSLPAFWAVSPPTSTDRARECGLVADLAVELELGGVDYVIGDQWTNHPIDCSANFAKVGVPSVVSLLMPEARRDYGKQGPAFGRVRFTAEDRANVVLHYRNLGLGGSGERLFAVRKAKRWVVAHRKVEWVS